MPTLDPGARAVSAPQVSDSDSFISPAIGTICTDEVMTMSLSFPNTLLEIRQQIASAWRRRPGPQLDRILNCQVSASVLSSSSNE